MAFDLSRPPRVASSPFAQGQQGARITAKYNRPADFKKFQQRQVEFDKFMNMTGGTGDISGTVPRLEGKQFLAVREPQLTARQPTFREAGADFMRGIGNFTRSVGSKVSPLSFIPGVGLVSNLLQGIGSFNTSFQNMQNQEGSLAMQIRALTPEQRREYDRLVGMQGFTIPEALKRVTGMAMGGIATLQ
tara:strand:+ start:276 stop:842 length:567 start_codon:yes stop_codon:yes gene_type:complete